MGNDPGDTAETQTLNHPVQGEEEAQDNPQDADHSGRQHEVVHQDLLVLLIQDISSHTQLLQYKPEELNPKTLLSVGNRTLQPILRNNLLIMKMYLEKFRVNFRNLKKKKFAQIPNSFSAFSLIKLQLTLNDFLNSC